MRRLVAALLTAALAAVPLAVGEYDQPAPVVATPPNPPSKTATTKPKRSKAPKAHRPTPQRERREPIVMYATLTAYTGTDAGMRGDDVTARGTRAQPWVTVAAWPGVPFGSRIEVPALGKTFVVDDRGGGIGYAHLDVYVGHDDKEIAMDFGKKRLEIEIYAPETAG